MRLNRRGRRAAARCLSAVAALAVVVTGVDDTSGTPVVDARADDGAVSLAAQEASRNEQQASAEDPALRLVDFMRSERCPTWVTSRGPRPCAEELADLLVPDCQGLEPLPPLWRRTRTGVGEPWSAWDRISEWSCPWDGLPPLSQEEFRRLPIAPSPITIQPDRVDVFVNLPTIVYTDPTTQTFTTTLLGTLIDVEATPARFTWDFGDGSDPIVTTSPGHPYPDHDVAYPYPREGTFTITLTTEFTGRYRITGTTTWRPVTGTATTTTTAGPLTPEEHHAHLTTSDCIQDPNGPWCDT